MKIIYRTTGIPNFDRALANLDNHLQLSGKSLSTRKIYSSALHKFICLKNKLPDDCTQYEIVQYFIDYKKKNALKSTSLKHYIFAIKYYLLNVSNKPELFGRIPIPKVKNYNIEVLSVKEMNHLLDTCLNLKERIILELLYETGIRVSELAKLNVEDFDFFHSVITIRNSKNMATRTVNFGNKLKQSLKEYMAVNKSLFSDSLFTSHFHPFINLSKSRITQILKAVVRRSNLTKRVNIHSLRHTFSVHYLNFGGTIFQLQKLLGHKNIETTCNYLQYTILKDSTIISNLDHCLFKDSNQIE